MTIPRPLQPLLAALPVLLLAACGGGHSGAGSGAAAVSAGPAVGADEVVVSGHITAPGTRGALLVFAFLGADADPTSAELLSVSTVESDGAFGFTLPPVETLTLAFLADGSNDGAIDGGDPVAVLTSPALANLQGGELVTVDEVALNFTARKATAGVLDVRRSGEPARTPTPVP
ncbi:MAG: hypothetical protein SF182_15720 [Deltaproteobacteria bacterium]|nr:hypothetical protein [Deltaproteobacteria bacterium]